MLIVSPYDYRSFKVRQSDHDYSIMRSEVSDLTSLRWIHGFLWALMHAIPVYVHGLGGWDTCICGEWEGKYVSLPPGQLAYHPGRGMPGRGIYGRADIFGAMLCHDML